MIRVDLENATELPAHDSPQHGPMGSTNIMNHTYIISNIYIYIIRIQVLNSEFTLGEC